ncbi:MAG: hypothetical protein AAB348_03545 [Patescibacteria group bacterium]
MPFSNILPSLPWPMIDIVMNVVAGLGAVLITYAIFLEAERRQDAVFVIASACLFIYALWIGNKIFSLAMAGLMIGAFIELVEIMLGKHVHSDALTEKYRHPNNK